MGELHRRASLWYEQNGFVSQAIGHPLDAQDVERAAELVEQAAINVLMRSELSSLATGVIRQLDLESLDLMWCWSAAFAMAGRWCCSIHPLHLCWLVSSIGSPKSGELGPGYLARFFVVAMLPY